MKSARWWNARSPTLSRECDHSPLALDGAGFDSSFWLNPLKLEDLLNYNLHARDVMLLRERSKLD